MRAQTFFVQLPRHPLLRMLTVACGAVLLAGLVAMSLIVGTLALAGTATWLLVRRWLGGHRRGPQDPSIIEGEFRVVSRSSLPHAD